MTEWRDAANILTLPNVPLGLSHLLPDRPGLYAIVVMNDVGMCFVAYVGIATTSLYRRWGSHRQPGGKVELADKLARRVKFGGSRSYVLVYYDTSDIGPDSLRESERQIIKIWNPPLNAPLWGKGSTSFLLTPSPVSGMIARRRGLVYATATIPPYHCMEWHPYVHALRAEKMANDGCHPMSLVI